MNKKISVIIAFIRRFYPKRLIFRLYMYFFSVAVFPGNWTHNLLRLLRQCFYHWATGTHIITHIHQSGNPVFSLSANRDYGSPCARFSDAKNAIGNVAHRGNVRTYIGSACDVTRSYGFPCRFRHIDLYDPQVWALFTVRTNLHGLFEHTVSISYFPRKKNIDK